MRSYFPTRKYDCITHRQHKATSTRLQNKQTTRRQLVAPLVLSFSVHGLFLCVPSFGCLLVLARRRGTKRLGELREEKSKHRGSSPAATVSVVLVSGPTTRLGTQILGLLPLPPGSCPRHESVVEPTACPLPYIGSPIPSEPATLAPTSCPCLRCAISLEVASLPLDPMASHHATKVTLLT